MLKKIGIAVAVLLIVLVGVVATRPDKFSIQRSTVVAAPAPVVFAQVNEFKKWQSWSPWEGMDPNMQRTYEGPDAGEGAKYAWQGNDKVGTGNMTIVSSHPPAHIGIRLEFTAPWQAVNQTDFKFNEEGGGTHVTWEMKGENSFMGKAMSLVFDMDKMIGADFEKGLANLKQVSEAAAAQAPAPATEATAPVTDATQPATGTTAP